MASARAVDSHNRNVRVAKSEKTCGGEAAKTVCAAPDAAKEFDAHGFTADEIQTADNMPTSRSTERISASDDTARLDAHCNHDR